MEKIVVSIEEIPWGRSEYKYHIRSVVEGIHYKTTWVGYKHEALRQHFTNIAKEMYSYVPKSSVNVIDNENK